MPVFSVPLRVIAMCIASEAMFFIPVALTYYNMKGADVGTFMLLMGIFRIATFVLEIPTGFLADKWSRPHQLMASRVFWLLSLVVLYYAENFSTLLASEVLAALACALRSGTQEAYLYEALRAQGKATRNNVTLWRSLLMTAAMATEAVASFCGGYLFTLNPHAPVLLSTAFAVLGLLISFALPAVPMQKSSRHKNPLKDLYLVTHHSLRRHPRLPGLLVAPFVMFGLTGTVFWVMQTRLNNLGFSPAMVGYALGAYFVLKMLATLGAGKLLARFGERTLIAAMPIALLLGTTLMFTTQHPLLVVFGTFIGAGLVHGVGSPVISALIDHEVSDGEHATVLSVASSIATLWGFVLMVTFSPLVNQLGETKTMMLFLAATLALAILPLLKLLKNPAQAPA